MSSILLGNPSVAFSSSESFSDFFFLSQMEIVGWCGFVGLCFVVTLVVVGMRKFMCFDAEEEERKPLALKVQDRVDAAQWGVKNALQLLIGLAAFGLSAAAVGTPVATFPDGTNFYYLGRCRGDICQEWKDQFTDTCGFMTFTTQGGGQNSNFALIFAGCGGALHVIILVMELSRRCCPDSCLGYDPDGDLGNPSKGYFPRWVLLLLRMLAFSFHVVSFTFALLYVLFSVRACDQGMFVKINMLTAGASFGSSFFCLCIVLVFDFIGIWLDGILGEVGRLVILSPEDETALKEIVTPSPITILPITTKPNNNDISTNHSKDTAEDDDAKKLIQQQQIAMDKLKKEMAEEKQKFMLALQQKNLEQQQQQKQHLPSAQPETQPQHNAGVDPNNHQQQEQHHEEIDHQHDAELAEQQKQILALQQLVEQLQHQHDTENKNSTAVVTIDPNPPLPHQTDDTQTLQPQQNQSPLKPLNTDNKVNPLAAALPAAANDNDDDPCRVDIGSEEHEKTDKKKKHDKSSKSVRKHHDNEPDSASASRREKFEAQQRMIQQLKDEQQALIDKLQGDQTSNDAAEASQDSKQ